MSITLSVGAVSVALDEDLYWSDEFDWSATEQAVDRGLTGAPILHLGTRQYGRPITLQPFDASSGWLTRADLAQLMSWANAPGQRMTLTLRGETHTVVFRHHEGGAVDARPLVFYSDADATDYVLVTLRFMTVAPE